MGVFSRLGRIIKSNFNAILDAAEDPEKSINQLIIEMRTGQKDAKEQVAQAMVDAKKLQRKLVESQQSAVKWKEKAKVALKRGDDKLAKEALGRAKSDAEMAKEFEKGAEAQHRAVANLKVALKALDKRIEEAKRKKHVLLARKKTAEATQAIGTTVSSMKVDTDAFAEFDRLAEKIEDMEVKANIQMEMNTDALEAQFDEVDARDEMDDELDSLKLEMGLIEPSHQLTENAGAGKKRKKKRRVVEVVEEDEYEDDEEDYDDDATEAAFAALADEEDEEVDDLPPARKKKKSSRKKSARRAPVEDDFEDE